MHSSKDNPVQGRCLGLVTSALSAV